MSRHRYQDMQGPPRIRDLPDARELLAAFNPAPDALLDLLRARIDDVMLREIAEADYGYLVEEHLHELRRIRDTGRVPAPLEWEPGEVLALFRWSEPENPRWKPGSMGVRGHTMRAFACAALLRAAADPANREADLAAEATLAQLLPSASELGPDLQAAAASFLAWAIDSVPEAEEERAFYAFGLLLLAVSLGRKVHPEERLGRLADWALAEEAQARDPDDGRSPLQRPQWLLGLAFADMRHSVWRSLARRMRDEAEGLASPEVKARLQDISSRVLGA